MIDTFRLTVTNLDTGKSESDTTSNVLAARRGFVKMVRLVESWSARVRCSVVLTYGDGFPLDSWSTAE